MNEGGDDSILYEMAAFLGTGESHEHQDVGRRDAKYDAEVQACQPYLQASDDDRRPDQHHAKQE